MTGSNGVARGSDASIDTRSALFVDVGILRIRCNRRAWSLTLAVDAGDSLAALDHRLAHTNGSSDAMKLLIEAWGMIVEGWIKVRELSKVKAMERIEADLIGSDPIGAHARGSLLCCRA